MLKVAVFVNSELIDEVNMWNMSENYGVGIQDYRVFNGKSEKMFDIKHNYQDGYWKLIEKVVKKLKPKPNPKQKQLQELLKYVHSRQGKLPKVGKRKSRKRVGGV